MTTKIIRTYAELSTFKTFFERYEYLCLNGIVGKETFGFDRYLNQKFYCSAEWKRIRDIVIVRDNGCDLSVKGHEIRGKILIHHMNPILLSDIETNSDFLMNPDYLVCTSQLTHNAIHYGDSSLLPKNIVERSMNDTCPWRKQQKEG